ncbi:MAG: alpha/beta fold hydrolase [Gammaproteobacteria bacterium]|nr:alpha/beta fold hydrolase [Gammaproteobacteria bacterium]
MQLNYKKYSDVGEPLLALHGLFGNLANWGAHCKKFAETFAVYGVDLRNHGDSPHADELNYQVMAEDVRELMVRLKLKHCYMIGHSMGGKVAMQLALSHPELIRKLIVVDIAPVAYSSKTDGHARILQGMETLKLDELCNRKDGEEKLQEFVEDEVTRKFILTNLTRGEAAGFSWRLNLDSIHKNYSKLREKLVGDEPYANPVLFVKGALSDYIHQKHEKDILRLFPAAAVKIVMEAGHWVHSERPQVFQKLALDFLQGGK